MANEEQLAILSRGVKAWNEWRRENPALSIDLKKANLRNKQLEKANLVNADLTEAELSFAHLTNTNLAFANLDRAVISFASLEGANLSGAILDNACLEDANLNNTILTGASLKNASLSPGGFLRIAGVHWAGGPDGLFCLPFYSLSFTGLLGPSLLIPSTSTLI